MKHHAEAVASDLLAVEEKFIPFVAGRIEDCSLLPLKLVATGADNAAGFP